MTSLTFTPTPTSSLGGLCDSPLNLTSVQHNITLCLPTLLPETQRLFPVLRSTWFKKLTGFFTLCCQLDHCRDQYQLHSLGTAPHNSVPGLYPIWYFTLLYISPSWYSLMWKKQLPNLCFCNRSYLQSLRSYSLCIRSGNVQCLQEANKAEINSPADSPAGNPELLLNAVQSRLTLGVTAVSLHQSVVLCLYFQR